MDQAVQQKIRTQMIKGARWIYICWMWMFSSLVMSPLFGSHSSISEISVPLLALVLSFVFIVQIVRYLPPTVLIVIQVFLWLAITLSLSASGAIVYLIVGLPIFFSEELILARKWLIPAASGLLAIYILARPGSWENFTLRIEAVVVIAVLVVLAYNAVFHHFTQAEELRLVNKKLTAANKRIATLTAERVHQEMARDLHDTLTQNIIGINMQLALVQMLNKKKDYEKAAEMVEKTQQMATDSIKLSRQMIKQYRNNDVGQKVSLQETLTKTIAVLEKDYSLHTQLTMNKDAALNHELVADIDRVVGEALMNVVKHGKTSAATVKVDITDDTVRTLIINHGKTWQPPKHKNNHYGITNMAERVAKHHGEIKFSPLKQGLVVTATFKIKEDEQ